MKIEVLRKEIKTLIEARTGHLCTGDASPYVHGTAVFIYDRQHEFIPKGLDDAWDGFLNLGALVAERLPCNATVIKEGDVPVGLIFLPEKE